MLKYAVVAGVIAAGGIGGAVAIRYLEPTVPTTYPKVQLLYSDGTPVLASEYRYGPSTVDLNLFDYPLSNEPNMLFDVGAPTPNGVGPSGGIVAFSAVCQHEGCEPPNISYYPAGACPSFNSGRPIIHCVCHGSTYDPTTSAPNGGAPILTGPALVPLPQTLLSWDSSTDYLYAVGVIGPPVFGHVTTLQGGSTAPSPAQLSAPLAPSQSCPP